MTITRVDLPVKIVSVKTLKDLVVSAGRRKAKETDPNKRHRLEIIQDEVRKLIKQL